MPKIQQLTHAFCLTAQCQPGKVRTDYFCQTTLGFCLECRSSGTKTYTFRYQNKYGQLKQRRVSPYGDITFSEAQKIARKWRAEVVTGGDPAVRKAEKRAVPTYDTLADQHHDCVKTYKNSGNTEAILRVHIRPRWGKKRLDEIATPDIAKWLAELRNSGKAPATVEKSGSPSTDRLNLPFAGKRRGSNSTRCAVSLGQGSTTPVIATCRRTKPLDCSRPPRLPAIRNSATSWGCSC